MLVEISHAFCHLLMFFKIIFFENSFRKTISAISLDPDQSRHFVGPDLGPNCLQRLLEDYTTPAKFCSTNWRCSRTVLEHLELF